MKKITLIALICIMQTIHAQQLSPVQLQKVKTQFDQALNAKKFDDAQTYLKQIEQGGRRSYAQELSAELAKAQQKDAEAKKLAGLHKEHKEKAEDVMRLRKLEQFQLGQMEEFYKHRNDKEFEHLKKQKELDEKEILQMHQTEMEQKRAMREIQQKYEKEIAELKKKLAEKK